MKSMLAMIPRRSGKTVSNLIEKFQGYLQSVGNCISRAVVVHMRSSHMAATSQVVAM
jgi:hypothetical protein